MEKTILQAGFKSVSDFFLKVVLPGMFGSILLFFAFVLFVPLPMVGSYIVLAFGVGIVLSTPYLFKNKLRTDIDQNIHLFITFAGTISTIDIDRRTFFTKLAENKDYGFISTISDKILYLAKSWNLGFTYTCRRLAKDIPSRVFSDFLDRFAAALDFGEDIHTFLRDEQSAVMDDYETIYREALSNIGMLREAFIAITISLAFGISTALLLPILMGISILTAIQWSLVALFFIDMMLLVLVNVFLPNDDLCHDLKIKDEGTKRIHFWMKVVSPISAVLIGALFYLGYFDFLVNIAIGLLPFGIVGYYAVIEEHTVFRRDKEFPSFIRSLGATIYSRQTGVMSSLEALQVHHFGILQDIISNLYTRLKIGSDKIKSWRYFAAESGSMLINRFTNIFSQSIYLGGHAEKIGEIISENFQKLISLRKLRYQQASALKGALYGSLAGFVATVYISISIAKLLSQMFSEAWSESTAQGEMAGLISSVIPQMPEVQPEAISIYLGVTIILHSFVSALLLKVVDGGNRFAMVFDFLAMLWIGAILSIVVPLVANKMFAGSLGMG